MVIIKEINFNNLIINFECEFCNKYENLISIEVFHPFDFIGNKYNLCESCIDNLDNIYYCESCNRHIYHNNGMRINIRYEPEYEQMICVKCLQAEWLKNGMKSFKEADFFNYSDLDKHGFNKKDDYFCRSKESYNRVENIFNLLKDDLKLKVIVNINSSGMGFEHHISLYIKLFPRIWSVK